MVAIDGAEKFNLRDMHPVAPLQLRKVLQSMAKSAGGRFEACGWLDYNLSQFK